MSSNMSEFRGSPAGSAASSPRSGDHSKPLSFDLILGGWCDGERLEHLEVNLPKAFESADVKSHVASIDMFGKRPRSARLKLKFSTEVPAAKRALQKEVRDKLRAVAWKPRGCEEPMWVSMDKSPAQRVMGRAVAKTSTFLWKSLGMPPKTLEVADWATGRAYIEQERVMGSHPAAHPRDHAPNNGHVRWVERDATTGLSVWVDLAAVARSAGKSVSEVEGLWTTQSQ